VQNTSTIN